MPGAYRLDASPQGSDGPTSHEDRRKDAAGRGHAEDNEELLRRVDCGRAGHAHRPSKERKRCVVDADGESGDRVALVP